MILAPEVRVHGGGRPLLVWRLARPVLAIATAVLGGGLGERDWVLNVEVDLAYDRMDPAAHLAELAAACGLDPARGAGLLTAAPVQRFRAAAVEGAQAVATVGLSVPVRAADPDDVAPARARPGTINLVAWVPVPLDPGAMANTLVTVTEAKTQALHDAGYDATGTASDAAVVCCPFPAATAGPPEPFAGPRSPWGHRLARATHAAVLAGARDWRHHHPPPQPLPTRR